MHVDGGAVGEAVCAGRGYESCECLVSRLSVSEHF